MGFQRILPLWAESLALMNELTPDQWGWWGMNGKEGATVLDLGTWLANHDQGHLAQIRRLCECTAAMPGFPVQ